MKKPGRPSRISIPQQLVALLTTEFPAAARVCDLFDEFLQQRTYNEAFCLKLMAVARQRAGVRWDIRRLAVLMLEHQILKLPPENVKDFDFVLTQLNLKQTSDNSRLISSLLKEGYSTTDLRQFIPEFRRKLGRLDRVHHKINGNKTSVSAIRDFVELSRQHCKLTLARYLFTPKEVVAEILAQAQVSDGLIDIAADPNLGADNAFSSTNFFITGGIHPVQASIYNDELPIIQRAINRYVRQSNMVNGEEV